MTLKPPKKGLTTRNFTRKTSLTPRGTTMKTSGASSTRKTVEQRLDKVVSEIIRGRDRVCITCDRELPLSAGHFMKRRHTATRWNLHNVNGQCMDCNRDDNWEVYKDAMIIKYGLEETSLIISLARADIKLATSELEQLLEILNKYNRGINHKH